MVARASTRIALAAVLAGCGFEGPGAAPVAGRALDAAHDGGGCESWSAPNVESSGGGGGSGWIRVHGRATGATIAAGARLSPEPAA